MAAYNKPVHLARTLASIYRQKPPFNFEVIVVDDGSPDNANREVCAEYPLVTYIRNERPPGYMNPARARNIAYRAARGDIIICQSDEVEHQGNAIEGCVRELQPGTFLICTVYNVSLTGKPIMHPLYEFTGVNEQRPLFFLGAVRRTDLFHIGGNEERFVAPGRDDAWFSECLERGAGLRAQYTDKVVGHHLAHARPPDMKQLVKPSEELYIQLVKEARWVAGDAPWPTVPRMMSFFWTGPMSWLRYLTLWSFRAHNPDWTIRLYSPTTPVVPKNFVGPEDDDNRYVGRDYTALLDDLAIERMPFELPAANLCAAQACDLCEWQLLSDEGGFYADMDILWLRPLDPLRKALGAVDAVFCPERESPAIGFFAAAPQSRVFKDIAAAAYAIVSPDNYQYYGTSVLHKMWPAAARRPGHEQNAYILQQFCNKYENDRIAYVPPATVYPFEWHEPDKIFTKTVPLPDDSFGLHWFGGHPLSRQRSIELSPETWRDHPCTMTAAIAALPGTLPSID
jgi:hypothetical protein